ncbi:hypothetical protein Plec18170_005365 [Paecilomyces lecythidis]
MNRSSPSVVYLDPSSYQSPEQGSSSRRFPSSISSSRRTSQSSSQSTEEPPRGTKRRRLDVYGPSTRASSSVAATRVAEDDSNIESVDLTEVEDDSALSKALAKQREDAVKAQGLAGDAEGRSVLTAYKCPVCMETPVDATSTVCGKCQSLLYGTNSMNQGLTGYLSSK